MVLIHRELKSCTPKFVSNVQGLFSTRSCVIMNANRRGGRRRPTHVQRLVNISRVTKVVKGGKKSSIRALVVVGDLCGRVGVGIGKGRDVKSALFKGVADGNKNSITVPVTDVKSIPHITNGHFGAAHVILRPSAPGSGVIAGGATRTVLETVGISNILAKQLGSSNLINNARATIEALKELKTHHSL